MKIAYIGGGSHFFELVSCEIAQTPELHGSEIFLYDPDFERVVLIEKVSKRISEHFKANLKISVAKEAAHALDGATATVSSIGVHGPAQAWHKLDVEAVAELGIMQTTGDSVGPTGISQGLRIIPHYIELAQLMEKYCPESYLLNHSNPMGAICRAVTKYSRIKTIGYCHNVDNAIRKFSKILDVPKIELDYNVAGVNHQVWLLSLRHKGKDVYPLLKQKLSEISEHPDRLFTMELMDVLGLYLLGGDRHIIEFFPHARTPTKPSEIGYNLKWRRDMITEKLLSEELTKNAAEIAKRASGEAPLVFPTQLSPEAMGHQIRALTQGPDMVHVVNIPNRGCVTNVPEWAVMETKAVIGQHGASPVFVGELPPEAARWTVAQVYAHELMIDAAVEGSREKAIRALACDPMVRDFKEAKTILDAIVKAQGERMARFR